MGNKNEETQVDVKEPVVDINDSHRRAALFERIRADHSLEITEDYIELISDLIEIHGEARAVDLASQLGVYLPYSKRKGACRVVASTSQNCS